jgi:DHA3 family macrolide efflux protein-like MFS transporter
MIAGAIIASFKKDWKHKIPIMFYAIAFAGIGYGILAFIPIGFFILIGITLLTMGLIVPFINILYSTILQTRVPHDKLGRVISIDTTLSIGISPLGSVIAGPLAELIGINLLYLSCAILMIIFIISLYFFTGIRHIDYSIQTEPPMPEIVE